METIKRASSYIIEQASNLPVVGIVLGSGLGSYADHVQDAVRVPYQNIKGFARSTVEGHAGQMVMGTLHKKRVCLMQGRFHFYEGYTMEQVVFPIRVMQAMGVKNLILTNAAGGINTTYNPGDLMLIHDHINFMGINPLVGKNIDQAGPRFPDMSRIYSPALRTLAKKCAFVQNLKLQEGVYAMMSGPSFETPAEIRMLRTMGADAVGMSTVPEAIVAVHGGMNVLGISCISNMAAGILDQPLNHQEVIETGERVRSQFASLLDAIVSKI